MSEIQLTICISKKPINLFPNMSSTAETENIQLDWIVDIFNEGKHIFNLSLPVLVDFDFSELSEPPLGQGSTIPVLELSRIFDDYDMNLDQLTRQRERMAKRKGIQFNIMVAGQTGLGKTTFINTIFDTKIIPSTGGHMEAPFLPQRTVNISRFRTSLDHGPTHLDLNVIDTPGYGDKMNNSFAWTPLTDYIDEQIRSYVFQEEQPYREKLRDNRVHCCLYFLPPTSKGISALDIVTMRELSKRVNLIPIIAKADAFNDTELRNFKLDVKKLLKTHRIKVCRLLSRSEASLKEIADEAPYDVISSNVKTMDDSGRYIRSRKYKWGTINVEDPKSSNFKRLKELIFDVYCTDFIASVELYYERCRTSLLRKRILKAKGYLEHESSSLPPITTSALEIIRELSFNKLDENGLLNYSCYEIFNQKYMDSLLAQINPQYILKALELRRKMTAKLKRKERQFKERYEAVFILEVKLNQEIAGLKYKVQALQLVTERLAAELLIKKEQKCTTKEPRSSLW